MASVTVYTSKQFNSTHREECPIPCSQTIEQFPFQGIKLLEFDTQLRAKIFGPHIQSAFSWPKLASLQLLNGLIRLKRYAQEMVSSNTFFYIYSGCVEHFSLPVIGMHLVLYAARPSLKDHSGVIFFAKSFTIDDFANRDGPICVLKELVYGH